MNNETFKRLKPSKILGVGSEGCVISTNNNNYCVKIYQNKALKSKMLINIINFFIRSNKILKTIYKTYYITEKKNSLERYISNNNLPNHFAYISNHNLKQLSENFTPFNISNADFLYNENYIKILLLYKYQME